MVERNRKTSQVVNLNSKEGLDYALWGLMRRYGDPPCPKSEWHAKPDSRLDFHLVRQTQDQYMSPVFGVMEKEEG